jgi:hypothetical protein
MINFFHRLKTIHFSPLKILISFSVLFLIFQFIVITPIKLELENGPKFDWPDEVANYFWVRELSTNHRLAIPEPVNSFADNLVHPRSFNVNFSGSLVPGSFLGLIILYAFLAKFFGLGAIIYFTPLVMLGGVWAFYFLLKKVFSSEKIALFSSILLLFSAPWQYYSFESLLPNVPFTSFVLISLAVLIYLKKNQLCLWGAFGLFSGLALAIRPAEFVWLALIYFVILVSKKKEFSLLGVVVMILGAWLAIFPSLFFQELIYGSFLISGYDKLPELVIQTNPVIRLLKQALIPFGFHPWLAVSNFWHYFILSSPFTALFSVFGIFLYLKKWREQTKSSKLYFWLTIFIFVWLLNYYGSWQFEDLRTLRLNQLGASYVRYWLILFVLSLPFVSLVIDEVSRRWKLKYFSLVVLIIFSAISFQQILFSDPNNILAVRRKVSANRIMAAKLLKDLPDQAIIITSRSDKIFFPERRVIETYGLRGDLNKILPILKKLAPIYQHENGALIEL